MAGPGSIKNFGGTNASSSAFATLLGNKSNNKIGNLDAIFNSLTEGTMIQKEDIESFLKIVNDDKIEWVE